MTILVITKRLHCLIIEAGSRQRYQRFFYIQTSVVNYNANCHVCMLGLQVITQSQVDLDDFRIAAMKGNLEALKSYINSGIPVCQVLRSGWTALMYAASCGKWAVVDFLLKNKSNVNFHRELFTPLMAACASTHEHEDDLVKCVILLLENGANVNASDRQKVTPLMYSAKEKRLKIVNTLLKREEINVDLQDNRGWTVGYFN